MVGNLLKCSVSKYSGIYSEDKLVNKYIIGIVYIPLSDKNKTDGGE